MVRWSFHIPCTWRCNRNGTDEETFKNQSSPKSFFYNYRIKGTDGQPDTWSSQSQTSDERLTFSLEEIFNLKPDVNSYWLTALSPSSITYPTPKKKMQKKKKHMFIQVNNLKNLNISWDFPQEVSTK